MSSLVPGGVEKEIKSQNSRPGVEVTVQETVSGHDGSHQDEETLEILQGKFLQQYFWCNVVILLWENFPLSKTRTTNANMTHLFTSQPIGAIQVGDMVATKFAYKQVFNVVDKWY